jgi:DNA replication protein DnaC
LTTLGIALPADALDTALSVAEQESLSPLAFLHRLLAEPAAARKQRALERRLREAHFRELTTLDGFDWAFNAKGVDRRAVEQLASCDFVRRRENVVLVGQTGLGKSRILQSVGHAACVLGYRVRYATSAKLLQEATAALADGSFARRLDAYARWDLLSPAPSKAGSISRLSSASQHPPLIHTATAPLVTTGLPKWYPS